MKEKYNSAILDQADLEISSRLRKNARETLTRISTDIVIPISAVFDRLKRLETTGVIIRHTSLLDAEKIGISVRVILLIRTNDNRKKELERYLTENSQVNNLSKINGKWSLMVEAWFKDINGLELFIETIREDFKEVEFSVLHVLEDLKRESFFVNYE